MKGNTVTKLKDILEGKYEVYFDMGSPGLMSKSVVAKDKKEAENLLFGENPPKRWSNESLNQWQTNVLKAARGEVEEKEADLEEAKKVLLIQNAKKHNKN
mgnify:CR=1 FL=1